MTVAKAVWNQIQSNDYRLMRRVHRWRAPRWFRILMILMTRMGDGWLWYSLGLILLVYGGEHRFLAIGAAASAASRRHPAFSRPEKNQQTPAPLRNRTPLLVPDPPTRQIFFPLGPHHHRLRHRPLARPVLSAIARRPAGRSPANRLLAHNPRHALSKRRPSRFRHRHSPRHHQLPHLHNILRACDTSAGASPQPHASQASRNSERGSGPIIFGFGRIEG